jgi:hypothetical protein
MLLKKDFWGSPNNIDSKASSNAQFRFREEAPALRLLRATGALRISTASTYMESGADARPEWNDFR